MKFPKKSTNKPVTDPNEPAENYPDTDCDQNAEQTQSHSYPQIIDLLPATVHPVVSQQVTLTSSQHGHGSMQEEILENTLQRNYPPDGGTRAVQNLTAFEKGLFDDDFDPGPNHDLFGGTHWETWSNPDYLYDFLEEKLPITQEERDESMLLEAIAGNNIVQPETNTKETQRVFSNTKPREDPHYPLSGFLKKTLPTSAAPQFDHMNEYLDLSDIDPDGYFECQHLAHARSEMEGFGIAEQAMAQGKYELSEQQGVLGAPCSSGSKFSKNTKDQRINRQTLAVQDSEPHRKKSKTTSDEIFSQTEDHITSVPSHLLAERPVCNCKNSKCLKLYCACFRKGVNCCVECKCTDCQNNVLVMSKSDLKRKQRNALHRAEAEESCCNCRMSFCEKSYCACARTNKGCGPNCKCFNCKNPHGRKGSHHHPYE